MKHNAYSVVLMGLMSFTLQAGAAYASNDIRPQQRVKSPAVFFESTGNEITSAPPFLSRTGEYDVYFNANQVRLTLPVNSSASHHDNIEQTDSPDKQGKSRANVFISFKDSNPRANITGMNELPGKINYFIGNDSVNWKTNLATYKELKVHQLYKGIDLLYYGKGARLEYDFILSAGAQPEQIRLQFEGAKAITIEAGDLVVSFADGKIRQPKPFIYQNHGGVKQEISGRYVVKSNTEVGFAIDDYVQDEVLVIDPPFPFIFFTHVGGSDLLEDAKSIAVDSNGNSYITGQTTAIDFPTTPGAHNPTGTGCGSCSFISKISADGSQLLYSTYLGGSAQDETRSIAVDSSGNAYITGYTGSQDFPTSASSFQPQNPTQVGGISAFVTKLNSSGQLVYSTYLGGTRSDTGSGITVDTNNRAYIVGHTASSDFPIAPLPCLPTDCPYQQTMDFTEVFVTRLNATGTGIEFSTYLGGSGMDIGKAIALGQGGDVFISGYTGSNDFDTTLGAHQLTLGGGNCPDSGGNPHPCYDVFVTRLTNNGTGLVYSTLLGGDNLDIGTAIAVDALNNAYVAGRTRSADFDTTPGAYSTTLAGNGDAFVAKINATNGSLVYSTLLGGEFSFVLEHEEDRAWGIGVDQLGRAIVVGETNAWNFPITSDGENCQLLNSPCGSLCAYAPYGFVTRLNPTGSDLIYSTYLGGGDGIDGAQGVAVDAAGNAYVTGYSGSTGLASAGAYDTQPNGMDAYVTKIDSQILPSPAPLHFALRAPAFLLPDGDPVFHFDVTNRTTQVARDPTIKVCVNSGKVAFTDANVKFERKGCCATMQLGTLKAGQTTVAKLSIVPLDYESADLKLTARVLAKGFTPTMQASSTPIRQPSSRKSGLTITLLLVLALTILFFAGWWLLRKGLKK